MKKGAKTLADLAHDILVEYNEKNRDIDDEALEERAQAMFGLIEKWTTPGDFLVIASRFKQVKEVIREVAAESMEDLMGQMVATVLGLYALSEARMMVHTNKEYHDKVE